MGFVEGEARHRWAPHEAENGKKMSNLGAFLWRQFDLPVVHVALCDLASGSTKICLHRRVGTETLSGLWALPGGRIDPGENPIDAAHREVWEEVSVRPLQLRLAGVLTFALAGRVEGETETGTKTGTKTDTHTQRLGCNFVFACHRWQGDVECREPLLHGPPEFFPADQLPSPVPAWITAIVPRIAAHKAPLFRHFDG